MHANHHLSFHLSAISKSNSMHYVGYWYQQTKEKSAKIHKFYIPKHRLSSHPQTSLRAQSLSLLRSTTAVCFGVGLTLVDQHRIVNPGGESPRFQASTHSSSLETPGWGISSSKSGSSSGSSPPKFLLPRFFLCGLPADEAGRAPFVLLELALSNFRFLLGFSPLAIEGCRLPVEKFAFGPRFIPFWFWMLRLLV